MRDLAEKWPPAPEWDRALLDTGNLRIRTIGGYAQTLVSGDLAAWARRSGIPGEGVGATGIAHGDRYMVRVARDRALAVSKTPLDVGAGWHDGGFAVSVLDAGLHVFEIEGPGLPELLAHATSLAPDATTPSAALSFAGVDALAYRHGSVACARVHVDRGLASYLWEWYLSHREVRPAWGPPALCREDPGMT